MSVEKSVEYLVANDGSNEHSKAFALNHFKDGGATLDEIRAIREEPFVKDEKPWVRLTCRIENPHDRMSDLELGLRTALLAMDQAAA